LNLLLVGREFIPVLFDLFFDLIEIRVHDAVLLVEGMLWL